MLRITLCSTPMDHFAVISLSGCIQLLTLLGFPCSIRQALASMPQDTVSTIPPDSTTLGIATTPHPSLQSRLRQCPLSPSTLTHPRRRQMWLQMLQIFHQTMPTAQCFANTQRLYPANDTSWMKGTYSSMNNTGAGLTLRDTATIQLLWAPQRTQELGVGSTPTFTPLLKRQRRREVWRRRTVTGWARVGTPRWC